MAAMVIACAARKVARGPADARMTFGYERVEGVAAVVNPTTLILIGLYLIREGMMRPIEPTGVAGRTVGIIAGVALATDTLTAWLTWSMR